MSSSVEVWKQGSGNGLAMGRGDLRKGNNGKNVSEGSRLKSK